MIVSNDQLTKAQSDLDRMRNQQHEVLANISSLQNSLSSCYGEALFFKSKLVETHQAWISQENTNSILLSELIGVKIQLKTITNFFVGQSVFLFCCVFFWAVKTLLWDSKNPAPQVLAGLRDMLNNKELPDKKSEVPEPDEFTFDNGQSKEIPIWDTEKECDVECSN